MSEIEKNSEKEVNSVSPIKAEGLRGSGEGEWYVVHTYSGHETKVKESIEKMVSVRGLEDKILSVVVPTEEVIEVRDGKRTTKKKKMFPGYVIIKMIVTNETWFLVRNAQGVTGFIGHGSKPTPLTKEEIARMGLEEVHIDLDIKEGDMVRVVSQPFEGFIGEVEEINDKKQTVRVKIDMNGRDTPVELGFIHVVKL